MSWEAVTALGTIFTGLVIVVTAAVGVSQLRQLRVQRRETAAIELARSLQDTTFARAFRLIFALPAGVSAADLQAGGPELAEAVQMLVNRFEALGLLVYRETISFEVAEDLIGGAVITVWDRIKDTARQIREDKNWPTYCEWFQWLAEQFEKRHRFEQTPVYIRFSDWGSSRKASAR